MPTYDFRCQECGVEEEFIRTIANRNDPAACPECSTNMVRVLKAPMVHRSWEDRPLEVRGHGTFTSRREFDKHCDKNDAMPVSADSSWFKQHDWEAESAAEDMCRELGYRDSDDFRRNYKKDVAEKEAERKLEASP